MMIVNCLIISTNITIINAKVMTKMWEIREGYEPEDIRYGERGGHDEIREAYEEG